MTSSDLECLEPDEAAERLLDDGWQRCFLAAEPRLSEAVETYRELGYEVRLLPVPRHTGRCHGCMTEEPDRFRVLFIRKGGDGAGEEDLPHD